MNSASVGYPKEGFGSVLDVTVAPLHPTSTFLRGGWYLHGRHLPRPCSRYLHRLVHRIPGLPRNRRGTDLGEGGAPGIGVVYFG